MRICPQILQKLRNKHVTVIIQGFWQRFRRSIKIATFYGYAIILFTHISINLRLATIISYYVMCVQVAQSKICSKRILSKDANKKTILNTQFATLRRGKFETVLTDNANIAIKNRFEIIF